VPVKKSITPEYLICLEDGKKLKMLKRHLKTAYNLTPEQYRERWGLPADYPMVAPNYAKHRSSLAKKIGQGTTPRGRGKAKGVPPGGVARCAGAAYPVHAAAPGRRRGPAGPDDRMETRTSLGRTRRTTRKPLPHRALCIERGLKMTGQRRLIARVLSEAEDHPDVEDVYRRASRSTARSRSRRSIAPSGCSRRRASWNAATSAAAAPATTRPTAATTTT
jgi:hypothetical protein